MAVEKQKSSQQEPLLDKNIKSLLKTTPTPQPATATQGAQRIFIELESEPEKAASYAKAYNELVTDIASILKGLLSGATGKEREEKFITEIWGVINSNFKLVHGTGTRAFLSASLEYGELDCDTSALLVYDAAKLLGIKMEFITAPNHALVKTDNFFFETTNGACYPLALLPSHHPVRQVLREDQIISLAYFSRGVAYAEQGKHEQALADFTQAIKINPKDAEAYYNRGNAFYRQGEFEQAISDFTQAIKINPAYAEAYYNRGNAFYRQGEFEQAVADYTQAISINPKDAEAYCNRGIAYENLGKKDLAAKDFETAKKLKPSSKVALSGS